jgi:general secretion pathway protein D
MRVTTFSIAATILIAAGIFTFWPGRNAGPGAAAAVAQAPEAAAKAESASSKVTGRNSDVSDVLNRRMDLKYNEVPLTDIVAQLTEQTGVTFYLSAKKLDEAGVAPDAPLSGNFRNIRLSTGLELILSSVELTYTVRDDVIVITTPEDAESRLEIRVYDCRDLLAMPAPVGADKLLPYRRARVTGGMGGGFFAVEDQPPGAGQSGRTAGAPSESGLGGAGPGGEADYDGPRTEHDLRAENLMSIVVTNIHPDTWDDVGGPGSVSEYNGLLVVTQTMQVHKEVEHVLDMLREAAGLQGPGKVVR